MQHVRSHVRAHDRLLGILQIDGLEHVLQNLLLQPLRHVLASQPLLQVVVFCGAGAGAPVTRIFCAGARPWDAWRASPRRLTFRLFRVFGTTARGSVRAPALPAAVGRASAARRNPGAARAGACPSAAEARRPLYPGRRRGRARRRAARGAPPQPRRAPRTPAAVRRRLLRSLTARCVAPQASSACEPLPSRAAGCLALRTPGALRRRLPPPLDPRLRCAAGSRAD